MHYFFLREALTRFVKFVRSSDMLASEILLSLIIVFAFKSSLSSYGYETLKANNQNPTVTSQFSSNSMSNINIFPRN